MLLLFVLTWSWRLSTLSLLGWESCRTIVPCCLLLPRWVVRHDIREAYRHPSFILFFHDLGSKVGSPGSLRRNLNDCNIRPQKSDFLDGVALLAVTERPGMEARQFLAQWRDPFATRRRRL